MKGEFWVIEGIDGTGKSTLVSCLAEHLTSRGLDVVTTKEQTDSVIGKLIPDCIKEGMNPLSILHLFMADRFDHAVWIQAQLDAGKHVICDRYIASTYAYQEVTLRTLVDDPWALFDRLHESLPLRADHVLVLDGDPEICFERIKGREVKSPYEKIEFLKEVRNNYAMLAGTRNWDIIDANRPMAAVWEEAAQWADSRLG